MSGMFIFYHKGCSVLSTAFSPSAEMTRLSVSCLGMTCPANLFAYTEWSLYLNVMCIEPVRCMFVIGTA